MQTKKCTLLPWKYIFSIFLKGSVILFVNKVKFEWELNDHIERKMKKKYEFQFLANKMSNDEIKKKITRVYPS
jgi:hypothetical protein